MSKIKAILALFQVVFIAAGIIPISTYVNYGGTPYEAPEISTPMYIVENGETERPPEDLSLRCNPNVAPVLCGIHKACRSHPLTECGAMDGIENETLEMQYGDPEPKIAHDHANWVKIADTTYIYDYTINFLNNAQFLLTLKQCSPR